MGESVYWLAQSGTVAHDLISEAVAASEQQHAEWKEAIKRLLAHFDLPKPQLGYYFECGLNRDPVHPHNLFLRDSEKAMVGMVKLIEAKGFKASIAYRQELKEKAVAFVLRKKADREQFNQIVGKLPPKIDFRKRLGRKLEEAYPQKNSAGTWFQKPGMNRLSTGEWVINHSQGGFEGAWPALLEAAGCVQMKAWEALKLIDEDKERKAVTA